MEKNMDLERKQQIMDSFILDFESIIIEKDMELINDLAEVATADNLKMETITVGENIADIMEKYTKENTVMMKKMGLEQCYSLMVADM